MTFHLPDAWFEPPADCCDNDSCLGDLCVERDEQAREDMEIEAADARRKRDDVS